MSGIGSRTSNPKDLFWIAIYQLKSDLSILQQDNVFIVYGDDPDNNFDSLIKTKAKLVKIPLKNNQINLSSFVFHLEEYGINNLLVEAGPKLTASIIEAGYYDDLVIYVAPILLGSDANNLVKLTQIKNIKQKIQFSFVDIRQIGPDLRVTLKAKKNDLD